MDHNLHKKLALLEAAAAIFDITEFYQHSPVALKTLNDLRKTILEMAGVNVKEVYHE